MNVKRKIDSRDQTNTHIKAGDLPKTSAVEASADVASAEASLENAANQLTTDRLTLLDLLGLDSEANIEVTADMPVEFFKVPDLLTAKKRALENNISYITAQITIETTRRNVITARDGQNWELDLTGTQVMGGGSGGGANAHFKSLSNGANMGSTISLDLTIPIDDVSAKQTVIAAKGSLEQAEILLSEDKRQLQLQVTQKIYALQSEKKEIELSKSSVKYYEQDVKNAEKLYNAGRISQFEYVNRQDNLTTAQQNLLSAKTQYFNDLVALDATLSHTLETWDIHMKDDR